MAAASGLYRLTEIYRWLYSLALLVLFSSIVEAAPVSTQGNSGKLGDPGSSRFDVSEIRVLGNTVLPSVDVERVIYPFVGPDKTIEDLNSARAALEAAYHAKGFGTVFVDLPEQTIVDGLVRVKVTEGKLAAVRVSGARYFSDRRILAAMPDAARGVVPNLPKLQAEIGQVDAVTPDRSVVPILKAGADPGTVDLSLKVDDRLPLHGSVEFNNQQTENTKPLRGIVSLSYTNLFERFDQLSIQYETSPQQTGQVGVAAANLGIHLYDGGPMLSLYYIDSKTDVATAGTLGVLGKGDIYGLRLPEVIQNTAAATSSVTFGVDYKHFLQSIAVDPTTSLDTPNSYMLFSVAYSGLWRTEPRQWNVDASANWGIRGIVNDADHFAAARFEGRPNFIYLRGDTSLTQLLPWGMRLTGRLSGQGAVEPLVSNEYFSIAGADGVRGYLESEEFGDNAIKGTLQISSPQLKAWKTGILADIYGFFDDGRVTFLEPLPGQPDHAELRSTGAGLELLGSRYFNGYFTWAYPLVAGPITAAHSGRVLFVVRGLF